MVWSHCGRPKKELKKLMTDRGLRWMTMLGNYGDELWVRSAAPRGHGQPAKHETAPWFSQFFIRRMVVDIKSW